MLDRSALVFDELKRVAAAVAGGELEARLRLEGLKGGAGEAAAEVNRMLDALSKPLHTATGTLHALAHGRIPDFVVDDYPGEFSRIKRDTNLCVAMVLGVLREIEELVTSAKNGRLSARGNDWDFDGCWKDLLSRLNELVDAFIQPFEVASRHVEMMSRGEIPERIAVRYPGDLNALRRNLNTLAETLAALLGDVNELCASAIEGRLDRRAEAERYGNEFRRIVTGINATLDAVVEPLKASACTLKRVAQGDLTVRLEGSFSGEFAGLQSDINSMAERLRQSMGQIREASQELAAEAGELTGISAALNENAQTTMTQAATASRTSQEMAANVHALSSAARETAGSVEEIAGGVGQVRVEVQSADEGARSALRTVSQLSGASASIGDVIKLISGIAGETNALSATAQRQAETAVGTARGFAVVADEVKRLANQIAEAAGGLAEKVTQMHETLGAPGAGGSRSAGSGEVTLKLTRLGQDLASGIRDISQVAWQTKLLSLNAAIEGARAGDSANQFTLVAREVGSLAGQTGQAANDIGGRLDTVAGSSREGAATIEAIAKTVGDLRQAADRIAQQARQRVESTARMGALADSTAAMAGLIVEHVGSVAEAASSTTSAASQTDREANQLRQTAVRLQELVNGFQI